MGAFFLSIYQGRSESRVAQKLLPNGPTSFIDRLCYRPLVPMRLKTRDAVAPIQSLTTMKSLIPEHKSANTLSYRHRGLMGELPSMGTPVWLK